MKRNNKKSNYLKLSEVQYYLGISKQTLDSLVRSGEIPSIRRYGVCYVPSYAFFSRLETFSLDGAA